MVLRDCLGGDRAAELRALVERLCATDPHDRPASAAEALARLERTVVVGQPTEVFVPSEMLAPTEELKVSRPSSPQASAEPVPRRPRRHAWGKLAAALAACAALAAAFLVLGGDSGQTPGRKGAPRLATGGRADRQAANAASSTADAPSTADGGSDAAGAAGGAAVDVPEAADSNDELGSALNQEGFELIKAGEYESAVPILEEAVGAFSPGTEDLDYAYALFNLGNALRLSGRPEDAIPVLEQRLAIPNQTGVVRRELAAARSEASP